MNDCGCPLVPAIILSTSTLDGVSKAPEPPSALLRLHGVAQKILPMTAGTTKSRQKMRVTLDLPTENFKSIVNVRCLNGCREPCTIVHYDRHAFRQSAALHRSGCARKLSILHGAVCIPHERAGCSDAHSERSRLYAWIPLLLPRRHVWNLLDACQRQEPLDLSHSGRAVPEAGLDAGAATELSRDSGFGSGHDALFRELSQGAATIRPAKSNTGRLRTNSSGFQGTA